MHHRRLAAGLTPKLLVASAILAVLDHMSASALRTVKGFGLDAHVSVLPSFSENHYLIFVTNSANFLGNASNHETYKRAQILFSIRVHL